jgi:hypothetical protein
MRRIIVLTTFLILAFAVGVKAQSTWHHPWAGATHHYTATVTDPEHDNPVRWWVATNASGNTRAVYNTDYSFITSGYNAVANQLEGTAVYDVQIAWNANLADDDTFYVTIEVDNTPSVLGCTNRMTSRVIVVRPFNELAWDVTGSSNPGTVVIGGPGDDTEDPTCPGSVVNPIWDSITDKHTNIGNSEIVFRVNKVNTLLDWQFEFDITEGTAQPILIDSIHFVDDLSNVLPISGQTGDLTGGVVNVNNTKDWVMAYVYIHNQMGVTLHINFDLITANNLTKDASNIFDIIPVDNNADHTIQEMPVIINFSGN